jgi:S-adenosylmethionine:tRNA ribosyltransferase-isomerase
VLLEELDFHIPEQLIAQAPVEPRDSCRLMFLPGGGEWQHQVFSDLTALLRPGDTLVFNDSRVLPARVHVHKPSGGSVELLFLRRLSDDEADGGGAASVSAVAGVPSTDELATAGGSAAQAERWEVLARPSNRLKSGGQLIGPGGERLQLRSLLGEGRWIVEGSPGGSLLDMMEEWGLMPLPPYIKTYATEPSSYQTVYASAPGSAAAPTAGLHFTPALLERLKQVGIGAAYVTLHVGLDTFQPIREATVEDHRIHRETYSVRSEALETIRAARRAGNRLVAVGTTATRVLETVVLSGGLDAPTGNAMGVSGSTQIFITPGYEFRAVDVLLTNFHLPRSSVLALTMAFAGRERVLAAYAEAIRAGYRFFSFGDAMLIEPEASPFSERPRHGGDHAHA